MNRQRPSSANTDVSRSHERLLRPMLLCAALTAAYPSFAAQTTDVTSLSLEQLLDISVVGASKYEQKQSEVAAAVSVITRQEIKVFGWRTLEEALASLPGVYTTYDRQYAHLGMRGFGVPGDFNTRMLVTINGNRINDPTFDTGPVGRQFPLDMDLVERIEFIAGPGGAVYGQNAMFGVVNVITRNGGDVDGTELAVAYQVPQATREGRVSFGKRLDNGVDVMLSVSGMRSRGADNFIDFGAAGVSGVAAGLDGDRDQQFFARVSAGPWSFDFVHGNHRKDDPTGAYKSDPLVAGQYQGDRYDVAQLQYLNRWTASLQASARLFMGRERYDSTLIYGTALSFPATGQWRGGELQLLSTAVDGHKLMGGVEYQDNTRQDQNVLSLANPINDIRLPASGYRFGLYAQDEWRVTDTLSATLGLRVDRNNATGTQSSPRAGLIWQATSVTTLKALYGRAHRAPNTFERDYTDGLTQVANPALTGETIDTLELVADHRVDRNLALRASIYQWTMRDLVTLGIDTASGLPQYQSGSQVNARGLELSADKDWDSGARLRGSLSVQNVSHANASRQLNSPKLLGKFNLSAPLPWAGLRAAYELRYDSQRLSLDGTDLGGYALSNLQLSTTALAKGLEVSLGVYNLFDKRYAQPGADTNWQNALEQDGRSVRLKASYRF